MVTISQAVVAAYVVGAIGMLIGAAVVATARVDRRRARNENGRQVYPPSRMDQILREELGDEVARQERDR